MIPLHFSFKMLYRAITKRESTHKLGTLCKVLTKDTQSFNSSHSSAYGLSSQAKAGINQLLLDLEKYVRWNLHFDRFDYFT